MQIIERRERAREIRLDEPQDASPGLETHLDVDSGAVLDVVARGLHESRHLPQLRDDPAGPFGLRSIGKQRLAREARSDDFRVDLGVAVPRPEHLQLVHPRLDVRRDDRMLDLFDRGEERRIDLMEAAAEPGERADVRVDGGATQVLEQVVMNVDSVQPGLAGQTSRAGTRGSRRRSGETAPMGTCPLIRWRSVSQLGERSSSQWYNNLPSIAMSGTLFVVATPIGNLEDITLRALRVLRTVDLIAAEDTRRTARLLAHHGISTPTLSFHQHNTRGRVPQLIARLQRGAVDRSGH